MSLIALLRGALPYLLVLAAFLATAGGGAWIGDNLRDAKWQKKWDAHIQEDADVTRQAEAKARDEEQRRQHSINKVMQDGQQQIDKARADAAYAAARAGSLRDEADRIADRLADSEAGLSACTAASSKAAAHYARMLANVFKLADQTAGVMASNADQSRARGLMCERAYDSIGLPE